MKYLYAALITLLLPIALVADEATPSKKHSCCQTTLVNAAPLADTSLYQVTSTWTNDAAQPVQLVSLRGKPQIVTMFFASCQFTCPLLVNDMKTMEAALSKELQDKVGFVLVSFDPERDTPAKLAAYRETHHLDANRWTLLQSNDGNVLELAALLGVKFKKDSNGQFAHSNVITLLDSEGNIVQQDIGFGRNRSNLAAELQLLLLKSNPASDQHASINQPQSKP
jgi:protein SCO1/2